jgi:hypothetical protein
MSMIHLVPKIQIPLLLSLSYLGLSFINYQNYATKIRSIIPTIKVAPPPNIAIAVPS